MNAKPEPWQIAAMNQEPTKDEGEAMSKNEFFPWKTEGISELKHYHNRYIGARKELHKLRELVFGDEVRENVAKRYSTCPDDYMPKVIRGAISDFQQAIKEAMEEKP